MSITIPRRIVEELGRRGISVEDVVVDLLAEALNLDPESTAQAHLEVAVKFLEEGRSLIDRDPLQASGKLYKAAEESVKAFSIHFNLDVLSSVKKRGRWTVAELEEAVEAISDKLGEWFIGAWDNAWTLHVWGFHEGKLNSEAVKRRVKSIERIVVEAGKTLKEATHSS